MITVPVEGMKDAHGYCTECGGGVNGSMTEHFIREHPAAYTVQVSVDGSYTPIYPAKVGSPEHVCEHCRRVFNTDRALEDHTRRIGTNMSDCNVSASPHARENAEKANAVARKEGLLHVGMLVAIDEAYGEGHTFRLAKRVPSLNFGEDHVGWECVLISKPVDSPRTLEDSYYFEERFIVDHGRVLRSNPAAPVEQSKVQRLDALADECGRLRHAIAEKDALLKQTADALADVMAFLGPTRTREFEKWRAKTRK